MVETNPRAVDEPIPEPPGLLGMFLIAASFACLLLLDPFGIETASGLRSEQAVLRITAPMYTASDRVAVVLIDDDFLRRTGRSWPVSYAEQGRLLRQVLQAAPAGVFVDLLYRQPHDVPQGATAGVPPDDPADLTRPLGSFGTVPLVFAGQVRRDGSVAEGLCTERLAGESGRLLDDESLLPSLRSWLDGRQPAGGIGLVGWWGCGDRYPLILAGRASERSPAFALYAAWCDGEGVARPECRARSAGSEADAAFVRPLVVRWGAFPPASQRPFYAEGVCQHYAPADGRVPLATRARMSLEQLLLGVFEDLRGSTQRDLALPCPAVTVIPASVLWFGDAAEVRELLRGRFVLVGAAVSGVSDWHQSAVHGQVPGVVLHAMALDNLLSLGEHYTTGMSTPMSVMSALVTLLILAWAVPRILLRYRERNSRALAAVALACWIALAAFIAWSGASGPSVFAALLVGLALDLIAPMQTFVYLFTIALMSLAAAACLRSGIAPANWIGMILVAFAFFHACKQFFKTEERKGFPHKGSFLGPALRPWLARREFHRFHRDERDVASPPEPVRQQGESS